MSGTSVAIGYVGCNSDFENPAACPIALDARSPKGARVEVFNRDQGGSNNWGSVQTLFSPRIDEEPIRFGYSLASSNEWLVVGAPDHPMPPSPPAFIGSVHVYKAVGGVYSLVQNISGSTAGQSFGYSLSLNQGVLAIGAPGLTTGRVSIYEQQPDGSFQFQADLATAGLANLYPGTNPTLSFGYAVSVDASSMCVAVGAPKSDYDDQFNNQGVVGVYCKAGTWGAATVQGFVMPTGVCTQVISNEVVPSEQMSFGASLALGPNYLMVGAPACDMQPDFGDTAGSVSVYTRSGSSITYLKQLNGANLEWGSQTKKFGQRVVLDGSYLAVSTVSIQSRGWVELFYETVPDAVDSGIWGRAAVMFPTELDQTATNVGTTPQMGWGLDMEGDYLVATANLKRNVQSGAGQGFVFRRWQCPPMQRFLMDNGTNVMCTACGSLGTTTYFSKNATCDPCGPGFANVTDPISGVASCQACAPGHYQDQMGQTSCKQCNPGTYMAGYGQTACFNCPTRTFGNETGATSCYTCGVGTFSNITGLSACYNCPAGTRNKFTGRSACTLCIAGMYFNGTGGTNCNFCAAGTYSSVAGAGFCDKCPVGQTSLDGGAPGRTGCENCTAGSFNNASLTDCWFCPLGHYTDQPGQSRCIPCPAGYSSEEEGAVACVECGYGSYGNETGQAGCTKCPPGKIGILPAQTNDSACFWCQPGQESLRLGSSSCSDCQPHYYAPFHGLLQCYGCPLGSGFTAYNDVNKSTDCMCNNGYMLPMNVSGSSVVVGHPEYCVECPDGTNCAVNSFVGNVQRSVCKSRYMGTVAGLCTPCPGFFDCATCTYQGCTCNSGYYTLTDGVTCAECPAGGVCSGGTSTPTIGSGWWSDSANFATWQKCSPAARCPGGGIGVCAQYMTGSLCATCQAGTYKEHRSGMCTPCPPMAVIGIMALAFVVGIEALFLYVIRAAYLNMSSFGSFIVAFNWAQLFGLLYVYPFDWGPTEQYVIRLTGIADFNIDFFFVECASYGGYSASTYEQVWYYKMLMPIPVFGALAGNCVVFILIWMMIKRGKLVKMIRASIQSVVVVAQMFFIPYIVTAVDPYRCVVNLDGGPDRWQYNYDYFCGVGAAWQEKMKAHAFSAGLIYGCSCFGFCILYLLWCMRDALPQVPPPRPPLPIPMNTNMAAQGPAAMGGDPNFVGIGMQQPGSPGGAAAPQQFDEYGVPIPAGGAAGPYAPTGMGDKSLSFTLNGEDSQTPLTGMAEVPAMALPPPAPWQPTNLKEMERAAQLAGILVRRFNSKRYLWSVVSMMRHTLAYMGPWIIFMFVPSMGDYMRMVCHAGGHILSLNFVCFINVYKIGGIKKIETITQLSLVAPTLIAVLTTAKVINNMPTLLPIVTCVACSAALAFSIYFVIKHALLVNKAAREKEERRKEWEALKAEAEAKEAAEAAKQPAMINQPEFEEIPNFGMDAPNGMALTALHADSDPDDSAFI